MYSHLVNYLLQLADTSLIYGQRLSEWCGHAPALELDMALSNIALDHIGAARLYYQYAAELIGNDATEDTLAYLRVDRDYRNLLLTEQPNGDFAQTLAKHFYYVIGLQLIYKDLISCKDERIAAIADKSLKEVNYHVRFGLDWLARLGGGTEESHEKIQTALNNMWPYSCEMFIPSKAEQGLIEEGILTDHSTLETDYKAQLKFHIEQAGLIVPDGTWFQKGGKEGLHTEHLGYILAEMQYLQRAYPGAEW